MDNERYYVASIGKVLKTLKQFNSENRELTLTELTTKTGYTKSNMLRILATLSQEGFIKYDASSRKYSLGYIIHSLSNSMGFIDIKEICRSVLEETAIKSQSLIHLSILEHDKILVIDRIFPSHGMEALVLASSIGGEVPVHCTGAGKIIAAYCTEKQKKLLLEKCKFESYSTNTITDRETFNQVLLDVQKKGYALNVGEHEPYLSCLTRPIFDSNNNLIAAFSISALKDVFQSAEFFNKINDISQETAKKLSRMFSNENY